MIKLAAAGKCGIPRFQMKHVRRKWHPLCVASAEDMAIRLTENRWNCNTAFHVAQNPTYAWINDSDSNDAVQEYSIVKRLSGSRWLYLDSVTFGWHDYPGALALILATLNGQHDYSRGRRILQLSIVMNSSKTVDHSLAVT